MPYKSVEELPANTKNLTPKQKRQWMRVFNSVHARTGDERAARAAAWAAVKRPRA